MLRIRDEFGVASGQRGDGTSNPRHPAWKASALPAELLPRHRHRIALSPVPLRDRRETGEWAQCPQARASPAPSAVWEAVSATARPHRVGVVDRETAAR